jgi:hypothetical protein
MPRTLCRAVSLVVNAAMSLAFGAVDSPAHTPIPEPVLPR